MLVASSSWATALRRARGKSPPWMHTAVPVAKSLWLAHQLPVAWQWLTGDVNRSRHAARAHFYPNCHPIIIDNRAPGATWANLCSRNSAVDHGRLEVTFCTLSARFNDCVVWKLLRCALTPWLHSLCCAVLLSHHG